VVLRGDSEESREGEEGSRGEREGEERSRDERADKSMPARASRTGCAPASILTSSEYVITTSCGDVGIPKSEAKPLKSELPVLLNVWLQITIGIN